MWLIAKKKTISKCAISTENMMRFQELKAIDLLVALLNNQPEEESYLPFRILKVISLDSKKTISKRAISTENVMRFQELKAIDLLVALLNNQPEEMSYLPLV